jgi:hypothetical protein
MQGVRGEYLKIANRVRDGETTLAAEAERLGIVEWRLRERVERAVELARDKAKGVAQRTCLGCGTKFRSEHVHNRLCSPCCRLARVYERGALG